MPRRKTGAGFASFIPPPAALMTTIDRAKYVGLGPAAAAQAVVDDYQTLAPGRLEESTRRNKVAVLTKVLTDLAGKNLDLPRLTPADMAAYRAYLKSHVESGVIQENYAYNIAKDWNAVCNLLFGEKDNKPGMGLKMRGFTQRAKLIQHLTVEEVDAMLAAMPHQRFRNDAYRQATATYLELALCTAGRIGSINTEELTFSCVDEVQGKMTFFVVKNKPLHEVVLTDRGVAAIKTQRMFLAAKGLLSRGDATPILTVAVGGLQSDQNLNRILHDLAAKAGLLKPVTSHVLRKSTGTLMASENPRLAREQLGITEKVFEKHYNQPNILDRLARRDIIPGATRRSRTLEEHVGALYLDMHNGRISQSEFDREFKRAMAENALRVGKGGEDPGIA